MKTSSRTPSFVWRCMRFLNQHAARRFSPNLLGGDLVLLLTTRGRKTGLPRVTPLQYEKEQGVFYVASARGQEADWYRNLAADPQVEVQARGERFQALAERITDPQRGADFLELRLKRHPNMMRMMLLLEGLPIRFTRHHLEDLASRRSLVALHRCEPSPNPNNLE